MDLSLCKDKAILSVMIDSQKPDHVDRLRAQWAEQRPDIDTSPMAVLGRINRIAHLTGPAILASMQKHGLDRGEFDVLATLRRSGPPFTLSPTNLYTSLMLSSGGLSNRLNRMEQKGFVQRSDNKSDGRSQLVSLSDRGLVLVDEAFEADMSLELGMLSGLDDNEFKQAEAALRMLCQSIESALSKR